ncbi:MAG: DUF6516 family protein [Anaerolineales bacterium]
MSQLHRYLTRLQNTILSRREIKIEALEIFDRSDKMGQTSEFYAVLRFYDGSRLQVVEKLVVETYTIFKSRYAYHYQDADNSTIFRYDNAPHHPEINTFPHHKHSKDDILPAQAPDLSEVLHEIDELIY